MSRRFIAGARCQECGAEDTLFLERPSTTDIVRCIACGFHEIRPQPNSSAMLDQQHDETAPQVIEIIDAST